MSNADVDTPPEIGVDPRVARDPMAVLQALRSDFPATAWCEVGLLHGGVSGGVYLAESEAGDRRVVRFPGADAKAATPDTARHELRTLSALSRIGLPCPTPIGLGCLDGEEYLLLEYLEGQPSGSPDVIQYGEGLASIHDVDCHAAGLNFLPTTRMNWRLPSPSPEASELKRALLAALGRFDAPPASSSGLRHGDYWPGNLVWNEGRLTGIIDWENALTGPSAADFCISRLDLLWTSGPDALNEFTERYLRRHPQPAAALTYWDLRAALRPLGSLELWSIAYPALGRPDIDTAHLTRWLEWFGEQALRR